MIHRVGGEELAWLLPGTAPFPRQRIRTAPKPGPAEGTLLAEAQDAVAQATHSLERGLAQRPADAAIARAVRVIATIGLAHPTLIDSPVVRENPLGETVRAPLLAMLERGQARGELRRDVGASSLLMSLEGLIFGELLASADSHRSPKALSSRVTGLFLEAHSPRHTHAAADDTR
jgi:hypothetical protein